jgi:hypothetical protein
MTGVVLMQAKQHTKQAKGGAQGGEEERRRRRKGRRDVTAGAGDVW